ncbi:MAG: phosphate regulon sensor histidine kinase PhoR [Pseudomonadales bacterium]
MLKTLSTRMWFIGGGLVVAAVLLGWLFGGVAWFLVAALSTFTALLLVEVGAFLRWAERPLRRPENQDVVWDRATNDIYQQLYRERARTREVLQRLRNLQVMTESLPDGAVVVSANGGIEQMNSAAKSLLGLQDRDKGQNLAALVRHPQVPALLKNQYQDNIIEFSSPLNSAQQLEIRKFQAEDQRLILLIRDVTELNRLLSMRQEFIANVSHELRSPLTVIVGYLEALSDPDMDVQAMRELVQRLQSPSNRMQSLVEDLLLLTRLESAPVPVEKDQQKVSVARVIDQVVGEVGPLAEPSHEIKVELQSAALVCGTEKELFSAFSNLLSNAIRYSPEGGLITVRWEDCAGGAEFSVTDQGVGIPTEHLTRLTERFYRVDLGGARVRGGTGLGLAIVKHVLKRHRSRLAVTSELGKGSRFACVFPEDQLLRTSSVSMEAQ